MSAKKTDKMQTSGEPKNTTAIILGGQSITINRLKSGKYYEAQKVFASILSEIEQTSQKATSKTEAIKVNIVDLFNIMPQKMAEFIAICASLEVDKILEDSYPEEIPTAFDICVKLNRVTENLKNFVAPMKGLGESLK